MGWSSKSWNHHHPQVRHRSAAPRLRGTPRGARCGLTGLPDGKGFFSNLRVGWFSNKHQQSICIFVFFICLFFICIFESFKLIVDFCCHLLLPNHPNFKTKEHSTVFSFFFKLEPSISTHQECQVGLESRFLLETNRDFFSTSNRSFLFSIFFSNTSPPVTTTYSTINEKLRDLTTL